jgi:hypothetical protein
MEKLLPLSLSVTCVFFVVVVNNRMSKKTKQMDTSVKKKVTSEARVCMCALDFK